MKSQIDKKDIYNLISFALKEYGGVTSKKDQLMNDSCVTKKIGSITVKITKVIVENSRLYLRKYDVTDENGEMVMSFVLGHATMLFSQSSRRYREKLLATEKIKGVMILKQSVFRNIVIPAAIIILNNTEKETWFTSVGSMDTLVDIMFDTFPCELKVYRSERITADNLLPEFYNGDDQIIEEKFKGNTTKELSEVATVIIGKSARREDLSDEGIPYLRARDIQNGRLQTRDVFEVSERASIYSRQFLQEGDILFTKNFNQNKLALVTEEDLPAIASNALFIIRPFEVTEDYLYRYLTSKTGNEIFNKQINRIKKGVTIPSVLLSDLIHVKVPLFDEETMRNFSNIETMTRDEVIETTKKYLEMIK